MSDSTFLAKWRRKCAKHLLSVPNFVVFSYLDFLDSVFCVIYKHLDLLFEGKASPCYCTTKKIDINGQLSDDNEISETLQYGKRKKLKELVVLLRFVEDLLNKSKGFEAIYISKNRKNGDFYRVGNRWSDCGCDSCISWMKTDDPKLHVEVNKASSQAIGNPNRTENVIFIHGILSSSSFWTKTLFPKLSESKKIKEYQMYAVDILGHGKSPKPRDSLYTLKEHVEWIEKSLISEYKLNSFHVVAHSMGCIIGLAPSNLSPLLPLLWPPTAFIWSIMVWYEHLSRCVCLLVCRNHRFWEALIKRLTSSRDVNFLVMDWTKHIHHSGWHTTHNVLYIGVKEMDKNLETLMKLKKRVHVIVGSRDKTSPPDFRHNIKTKFPDVELHNIPNAGHRSIILTRETDFAHNLFHIWENTASHHHHNAHTEGE
ncbi:hypothetical protein ES288_A11G264400v1 [Gossypium darwinii]|uniref:AB hydrolase-1 domain-containing protein n=1 Tax=Gossypium darwinii TaxID=34276 RepID=A0A5D2EQK2_GOSDA|nr:hypothetical protein ES288_A11G264400v1 [Gossypium darwinii]